MNEQQIDQAVVDLLADGRERKVAYVIAKVAEGRESDDELSRVETAIRRLVAAGRLEAWGDVSDWRQSEVRSLKCAFGAIVGE